VAHAKPEERALLGTNCQQETVRRDLGCLDAAAPPDFLGKLALDCLPFVSTIRGMRDPVKHLDQGA
jgi:hypothetical protein